MSNDLDTAADAADKLIAKLSQARRDIPEYAEIVRERNAAIEEYKRLWERHAPAIHAAAREREDDNAALFSN